MASVTGPTNPAAETTVSDQEVFDAFPDVHLTYDNIEHFRGLLQHRLMINRCAECGFWIYPLRPLCPECWSRDVRATEVSGEGVLYYQTTLLEGRHIAGFEYPHLTGGVELVEQKGLRYLAPIVGVTGEEVVEDTPVQVVWLDTTAGPVAGFTPVAGE
jgi:uncharacterized OB-fold protein